MADRFRDVPSFRLLLWSVIGMCAVCAVAAMLLTYFPPPHDSGLTDTFTSVFKLGMGAIVGVYGGGRPCEGSGGR